MSPSSAFNAAVAASSEVVSRVQADAHRAILDIKKYARPSLGRALFQLLNTGLPFIGMWVLMYFSLRWSYWITLALAVPTAFLMVRMFIFQHDCGHGSFFRSKKANNAIGTAIGVLTLMPYDYWRKTHSIHHATAGDLSRRGSGDVDTLTVREYEGMTKSKRFWYRVVRSPPILLIFGPIYQFILKHRLPWDLPLSWRREWTSVHVTNLGLLLVLVLSWLTVGIGPFLAIQLPLALISGSMGIYLFYVQHQFEDVYWSDENEDWSFYRAAMEGSSWFDMPAVLHWCTGNIGFHHIHHLSSRIPNYRLRRCMKENPHLRQNARRLTMWQSVKCLRLKLWDESERRLVSFRELRRRRALRAV